MPYQTHTLRQLYYVFKHKRIHGLRLDLLFETHKFMQSYGGLGWCIDSRSRHVTFYDMKISKEVRIPWRYS
jgi:hypothetical protein